MLKSVVQKTEDLRRLIDGSASVSTMQNPASSVSWRILLAVSGGMDSMCMADIFLQSFGPSFFAIAHCNFSLRGEESDGDEKFVREWAERNGVEIFVNRFDTVVYARERGISIEMAARELRYGWFAELCSEHDFAALAVAHNANDNAETLMLNLLRGTGIKGLHGMAVISEVQIRRDLPQMLVFRPLLENTRKQIEGYVLSHRVPYRNDSTNFETDYKRNRIRNDVFPVFEKINTSFIRTLNREMGYFSEAGDIVDDWCRSHLDSVVTYNPDPVISVPSLLAIPHWRYLLYYILEPLGFNHQTLASLESLLVSGRTVSGKRFESPTHILYAERNELVCIPAFTISNGACPSVKEGQSVGADEFVVVRGAGKYRIGDDDFTVEIIPWSENLPLKQPQGVIVMDAEKIKFPFVCRRWRQGDWLIPFGMKGKKKVSDLFTDLKYDSFAKKSAIIIVDTQSDGLAEQQHISGILGVRIDNRYKISPSTGLCIRLSR